MLRSLVSIRAWGPTRVIVAPPLTLQQWRFFAGFHPTIPDNKSTDRKDLKRSLTSCTINVKTVKQDGTPKMPLESAIKSAKQLRKAIAKQEAKAKREAQAKQEAQAKREAAKREAQAKQAAAKREAQAKQAAAKREAQAKQGDEAKKRSKHRSSPKVTVKKEKSPIDQQLAELRKTLNNKPRRPVGAFTHYLRHMAHFQEDKPLRQFFYYVKGEWHKLEKDKHPDYLAFVKKSQQDKVRFAAEVENFQKLKKEYLALRPPPNKRRKT